MEEYEWLGANSPVPMLAHLRERVSARKLLLFCVAYDLSWKIHDSYTLDNCEAVVRYADSAMTASDLELVRIVPQTWAENPQEWASSKVRGHFGASTPDIAPGECIPLLREIFGNPFRPVNFDAAWRTGTALLLAKQMYDSREFSAMPILADALQDAGCDSDDVLNHCRDVGGTHVRGCWVVDLVLGKE